VKALGLSAGIAIVALDRLRILLDERFGVHADPRRSGNNNDGNDDNKERLVVIGRVVGGWRSRR
jgi:hypothetical protein